jgi:hypothetical protein
MIKFEITWYLIIEQDLNMLTVYFNIKEYNRSNIENISEYHVTSI